MSIELIKYALFSRKNKFTDEDIGLGVFLDCVSSDNPRGNLLFKKLTPQTTERIYVPLTSISFLQVIQGWVCKTFIVKESRQRREGQNFDCRHL